MSTEDLGQIEDHLDESLQRIEQRLERSIVDKLEKQRKQPLTTWTSAVIAVVAGLAWLIRIDTTKVDHNEFGALAKNVATISERLDNHKTQEWHPGNANTREDLATIKAQLDQLRLDVQELKKGITAKL